MAVKYLGGAAIALVMGGCTFEPALTENIVAYNRTVERSNNEVLLLNVLRAKDRQPMYFSTVTQFTPNISGTAGVNINLPLSPTAYTTLGITPSSSVTSSNLTTIGVEHTHEFMRGFLQPISAELFDYFWQQGWPNALLLHVFVSRIEVIPADDKGHALKGTRARVFTNAPSAEPPPISFKEENCQKDDFAMAHQTERYLCFVKLVRDLSPFLRFAASKSSDLVSPKIDARNIRDLRPFVDAAKPEAKLRVVSEKEGRVFQIVKESRGKDLCIVDPSRERDHSFARRSSFFECEGTKDDSKSGAVSATLQKIPQIKQRIAARMKERGADKVRLQRILDEMEKGQLSIWKKFAELDEFCSSPSGNCLFVLHLRSPEAMVYYLGEAARAYLAPSPRAVLLFDTQYFQPERVDTIPASCIGPQSDGRYFMALFALERGTGGSVSVLHDGQTYTVPRTGCHRSMQALSLVNLIIGLQRRAAELPRTTVVTTPGP